MNGAIAPLGDVAALARGVVELIQDPPAPRALLNSIARYDRESIVRAYESVLDECVEALE